MTYRTTSARYSPGGGQKPPDPEKPDEEGEWVLVNTTASSSTAYYRLFWTWRKVEYEAVVSQGG